MPSFTQSRQVRKQNIILVPDLVSALRTIRREYMRLSETLLTDKGPITDVIKKTGLTVLIYMLWLLALPVASQTSSTTATPPVQLSPTAISNEASPEFDAGQAATATAVALIEPVEHKVMMRPIELAAGRVHWVDRTYPYGSTQWDTRPAHLGVEFINPRGTAVYAAASGLAVFAHSDDDTLVGPRLDYYGRVIVLAHEFRSLAGEPVFSLYGHLERIDVQQGDWVEVGQQIGTIGSSGIAIGAHLHFEVRVREPLSYLMTRNPELWLKHYVNHGMIAGFIYDDDGEAINGKRLVVRSESTTREVYSYAGDLVNPDPVWGENFTVSDLRAGEYEIVVLKESGALAYREPVQVEAYRTTMVDIVIDE